LSDAEEDDLCDSAFEPLSRDSDEHIIHEILRERATTNKKSPNRKAEFFYLLIKYKNRPS
jgi:hypothetical protein